MNKIIKEDIEKILSTDFDFSSLKNNTILITGATGLIDHLIITLIYMLNQKGMNISVIAIMRDRNKARKKFDRIYNENWLQIIEGNITSTININCEIDYVLHLACETNSHNFLHQPVDTIDSIVSGTKSILELAYKNKVKSLVYISSMEVYGFSDKEIVFDENTYEQLDITNVRNSYPMAKRLAENMCCGYNYQYGVPVKIARLEQMFGAGVEKHDSRVFAEFAKCLVEQKDIILNSNGKSKRMYLYTMDAITAIFTILIKGKNGEAYNVANENTYCNIEEMAQILIQSLNGNVNVVIKNHNDSGENLKYSKQHALYLDTGKIKKLGWSATYELAEMYNRMIQAWNIYRHKDEDSMSITTSIVLATYNGEKYILEQLDSLRNQTVTIDEVLIYDDCSQDNTYSIIQEYIKKYHLTQWKLYVNEVNVGWKQNFHNLIIDASGDIIFPCDQDDIWELDKIELMTNIMIDNSEINILASNYAVQYEKDSKRVKGHVKQHNDGSLKIMKFNEKFLYSRISGASFAIRSNIKPLFFKYWNPIFAHDALLFFIGQLSESFYLVDIQTMIFRRHSSNASDRRSARNIEFLVNSFYYLDQVIDMCNLFIENECVEGKEKKIEHINETKIWIEYRKKFCVTKNIMFWLKSLKYIRYYWTNTGWLADFYTVYIVQ